MNECLIDIGHDRWFVREAGYGPAVIFGHSLTFDADMWQAQMTALSPYFRAIAVDFPGHGRSQTVSQNYSLDDIADALAHLALRLGLHQFAYVGLSLGGMVGMRLALKYPDRLSALVLCNTSPYAENKRELFHQVNETSRCQPGNPATINFVLQLMFSAAFRQARPDIVQQYYNKLNVQGTDGKYWTAKAVIWRSAIVERLGEIRTPTLVIASEQDASINFAESQRIHQGIAGSEWALLNDTGHMSCVERPDDVNRLLLAFLTRHIQAAS